MQFRFVGGWSFCTHIVFVVLFLLAFIYIVLILSRHVRIVSSLPPRVEVRSHLDPHDSVVRSFSLLYCMWLRRVICFYIMCVLRCVLIRGTVARNHHFGSRVEQLVAWSTDGLCKCT